MVEKQVKSWKLGWTYDYVNKCVNEEESLLHKICRCDKGTSSELNKNKNFLKSHVNNSAFLIATPSYKFDMAI